MKRILITLVKAMSISLCITAIVIPQALQQYTKTIVSGQEKWTLHKQYISTFDKEEPEPKQIDPVNLFHQKQIVSANSLFDDRWTLQLPYPTDAYLIATEANNNFMISAGYNFLSSTLYGEIITSTDKGETWNINRSGNDTIFYTMDMEGNSIWVGGIEFDFEAEIYNSYLIKSTDLGKSWDEKLSIDSFAVLYLNFFDENTGVAIGEKELSDSFSVKIFHTSDGGDSWTANVNIFQSGFQGPQSYHFSNPDYGWKCIKDPYPSDIGRIMNTTDRGKTWNLQMIDTLQSLNFIKFFNSNYGWTIGEKHSGMNSYLILYSTSNGGNNWSEQSLMEDNFYGYDMFIQDSLNCWLVVSGLNGLTTVYKTTDGFNTLDTLSQINGINIDMGTVKFISDNEGWITANLGSIFYTSDGGYNWQQKNKSVTVHDLYSVDFIDSSSGWAASSDPYEENVLIQTKNGGKDWNILITDTTEMFEDVDLVSNETGFLISNVIFSYPAQSSLFSTYDGGLTWDETTFDSTILGDIIFVDQNNGWVVGDKNYNPFIIHTSNSGTDWNEQTNINFSGLGLTNVDFANTTHGFAVGDFGIVMKTTNGGNSWRVSWGNLDPNQFWINYNLTGVFMPTPTSCWIAGNEGYSGNTTMIMHTTNSGANWDTVSFSNGNINQIVFINESEGYCVGHYYPDYETTDGGSSWSQISYPGNVNKMFFLNKSLGWAVGDDGRIFKYSNFPVSVDDQREEHYPQTYTLYQNFPNPFNPSTTINFSLPSSSYATLKIYNALGEKVAVLLDKELAIGTFKVEWNAIGLPSGVYFYQLKADSFVETKKMILMK